MYGKVFRSLWDGSLRGLPHPQLVFVYLIAHADRAGTVNLIRRKIADDTGISLEEVNAALEHLLAPDPESRQPEHEGRRILPVDAERSWGWQIVNYEFYRGLRNEDDRREQNRQAKARQRRSASVSHGQPVSSHAEGEGDVEAEEEKPTPVRPRAARSAGSGEPDGFATWYEAYPRHVARRAASHAYRAAIKRTDAATLLAAIPRYIASLAGTTTEFKHPATWLNGDCWLDEPKPTNGVVELDENNAAVARSRKILAEKEAQRAAARNSG